MPVRRLTELDEPVRHRLEEVSVIQLAGRVSRAAADPATDGIVAYGAEKGAIGRWARLDALLKRLAAETS